MWRVVLNRPEVKNAHDLETFKELVSAFQEVEDNLASQRLLEQEATVQNDALRSARDALALVNNRYRAGTASLLDVLVAQTTAYTAERTALTITGRQYTASVVLVKALGGGWHPGPLTPEGGDTLGQR